LAADLAVLSTLIREIEAVNSIIIIFLALAGVFGLYLLINLITKGIQRNTLRRKGKTVDWNIALDRTRGGEGVFIIHQKTLWWLAGEPPKDSAELYMEIEQKGLLVRSHPNESLPDLLAKFAPGNFKIIHGTPFVDPE
jgi:hypothetical protein